MVVTTIPELERRMRPGGWSQVGFLGDTESLEEVLARDARTLAELRVSCDEIAEKLSLLLQTLGTRVLELYAELAELVEDDVEHKLTYFRSGSMRQRGFVLERWTGSAASKAP